MGATVLYTLVKPRRVVNGGSTSGWEKLRQIWGESPLIRESDLPTLRALAVADNYHAEMWAHLADLVADYGSVQLDAEF